MTHEMVTWLGGVLDRIEQTGQAAASLQADPENGWGIEGIAITPHIGIVHEDEARQHIATHSPANVLPLVAAARAIIAEHEIQWPEADFRYCRVCQDREAHDAALAPCRTLRLLAAGFSHWPGYRPEWGPQ